MTQQDIWDLGKAIDELKEQAKAKDTQIVKLTKSLARLRADIKRAKAREQGARDKAEQQLRDEIATLIQVSEGCLESKVGKLAARQTEQDARAGASDLFEDEVRQLLGLGPREEAVRDEGD